MRQSCIIVIVTCSLAVSLLTMVVGYTLCYAQTIWQRRDSNFIRVVGFNINNKIMACMNSIIYHTGLVKDIMNGEAQKRLRFQQKKPPDRGGICFLGDSEYTTWYDLEKDLSALQTSCFNAGFGGARTDDVFNNLETLCMQWKPNMVVLHVMGNDWDYSRNITETLLAIHVVANIRKICQKIQTYENPPRVAIMLSPRRPIYTDQKWLFMKEVGTRLQRSGFVDIIDMRHIKHDVSHYRVDRVHLNDVGHSYKAAFMVPQISALVNREAEMCTPEVQ